MIDPITASILGGLVVALISGIIFVFIRRKFQKNDKRDIKMEEDAVIIENMQKNIWRLNKTVLIMAKMIDDQTAKVHAELNTSLEDIATELLDDKG